MPAKLRLRAIALPVALLLSGCAAVGPDFHAPVSEAPADWSSWQSAASPLHDPVLRGNLSPVAERWWETFKDPVLDALEARARMASPDLQTAALRFAQSRAQRLTVAAQRGPQIAAGADASHQRQSEHGAGTRMLDVLGPPNRDELVKMLSDPYKLYQAGFDASWELDLWGRVRRSVEGADADVAGAGAALDGVRLGIAAEVARNYFELRGVQQQLSLAQADLAAAGQYLELLQARADGGVNSELDATRQRALQADLRARLPQLFEQEAQAASQLSLLLGEHPGALRVELSAASSQLVPPVAPDLALGLPSELARRRPDIHQAEARLHSATAAIGIAVADLYPRITLGASFGLESTSTSNLGNWGSRRWSIGPSLSVPIFDSGRRRTVVVLRKLQEQEAAIAYQQTVLRAWHEIDTALTGYTAMRQRNLSLAEREQEAREACRLAEVRYRHGQSNFLEALDAQRSLLAAQREYANSSSRLSIRLVAIYKALGGAAASAEPDPSALLLRRD